MTWKRKRKNIYLFSSSYVHIKSIIIPSSFIFYFYLLNKRMMKTFFTCWILLYCDSQSFWHESLTKHNPLRKNLFSQVFIRLSVDMYNMMTWYITITFEHLNWYTYLNLSIMWKAYNFDVCVFMLPEPEIWQMACQNYLYIFEIT